MNREQHDGIEVEAARRLSLEWDRQSSSGWDSPPQNRIDRIDPVKTTLCLLPVTLYEPIDIPLPTSHAPQGNLPSRIAGYVDRKNSVIAVAQRFGPEVRRFTLAHLIGHLQLHREDFRDFPLYAGDPTPSQRSQPDQQANRFAEELLMPADLVKAYFAEVFGADTLRHRKPEEALAGRLSSGVGRKITVAQLQAKGREWLASLAAEYGNDSLPSLAQRFRVSRAAMSIRLMKLHLV